MENMRERWSWGIIMGLVVLAVMANGAPSDAECREERRLGINACKPVLIGRNPTAECCERARVTHVECFCPAVSPKLVAAIGGVNRLIGLIEGCGRRVPNHFQCGSITTP